MKKAALFLLILLPVLAINALATCASAGTTSYSGSSITVTGVTGCQVTLQYFSGSVAGAQSSSGGNCVGSDCRNKVIITSDAACTGTIVYENAIVLDGSGDGVDRWVSGQNIVLASGSGVCAYISLGGNGNGSKYVNLTVTLSNAPF